MIIGNEVLDDGMLVISYYNESGKIDFIRKKLMSSDLFNWVESTQVTNVKNWNGKYLKQEKCSGKYVNDFRIQEIIKERLSQNELDKIYNDDFFPKKSYMDIEIKVTDDTFADPAIAAMPVGLISFCNDDNSIYVLSIMTNDDNPEGLSTEHIRTMETEINAYFSEVVPLKSTDKWLFEQKFTIKYKFFKTEEELLTFYFHKLAPIHSFLTGWNFIEFDWKYLLNRSKRLKIGALDKMPTPSTFSKNKIPIHMGMLDYMETVMQLKPFKVVENYQLETIAKVALGVTKLDHGYDSFLEFQKDIYLYTKYNIIDCILVKLIEDKYALLEVAFSMANIANIEISRVFAPVHITQILMCREFLNKNLKMMKLPWKEQKEEDTSTYVGAYVKDPKPNHYRYISCYDVKSMYPNIQMQFNISPDSYLGKQDEIKTDGTEISTKNNTIFSSKSDSVAKTILSRLYNERIKTQSIVSKMKEENG